MIIVSFYHQYKNQVVNWIKILHRISTERVAQPTKNQIILLIDFKEVKQEMKIK